MKKLPVQTALRRAAALTLALVLTLPIMLLTSSIWRVSAAGEKPEFYITTNGNSAYSGDSITVTYYVKNQTGQPLYSFDGKLNYDTKVFEYVKCAYLHDMVNSEGKQTVIVDDAKKAEGEIGFTFVDTTNAQLPDKCTKGFIDVVLKVKGESGSGKISGAIENCYIGKDEESSVNCCKDDVPIAVGGKAISVVTTTTTSKTSTRTTTTTRSTTKKTTTTQTLSGDNRLISLTISEGTLSPGFDPNVAAYIVGVPFETTSLRITAAPYNSAAVVTGDGVKELSVGNNSLNINVTAPNGTVRQYGVIVVRAEQVNSAAVNIASSTDTTTEPTTTTTTADQMFGFTTAATLPTVPSTVVPPGSVSLGGDTMKLIGIVAAIAALFFFGFMSGFFIDKSNKNKQALRQQLEELELRKLQYNAMMQRTGYGQSQPNYNSGGYSAESAPDISSPYDTDYSGYSDYSDNADYSSVTEVYDDYDDSYEEDYDGYGGLKGLTNAAYPDYDETEDY